MILVRTASALSILALAAAPARAAAQKVHEIRLQVDRDKSLYRFLPARVTVAPGDVLHFKVASGAPHSIVFETKGLPPASRAAMLAAFGRKSGEPTSPMLARDGDEYKVVLPKLPAGTYKYFCLPHRAYDMVGEIVVK